jgi:serine/threonine-protein kinase
MAKLQFTKNEIYGKWSLKHQLPGGGNGSLWTTFDSDGNEFVIKLLKKDNQTAKSRFLDEIKVIKENQDISGVMPMIDDCASDDEAEVLWYVMRKGVLIQKHLTKASSIDIVQAIAELGDVLTALHERGVSHRDIKPQNLFYLDGHFVIGDFGLVDYPEKEDNVTLEGEPLGPRWTIAPEMRRNPESADGLKADVYSLAKSFWILLSGVEKGFEGQYNPSGSIGIKHYQPNMYLSVLEDLLIVATENDPDLRPSMIEFTSGLKNWLEIVADFEAKNTLDWVLIQQKLFPTVLPKRVIWEDPDSIISILNIVGGIDNLNHMFFPDSGGMDLEGAIRSNEVGCIELDCGIKYIIKPKRLLFESFSSDPEWNYFRLELDTLKPKYGNSEDGSEQLTEISPGVYKDQYYSENYFSEYGKIPRDFRTIVRYFHGDFVIFRKTSSYNYTSETYDGRHCKVNADQFRSYIQSLIDIGYKVETGKTDDGKYFTRYINGPMPRI